MSALSMTLPAAWSTPLTEGATVPDVLLKLRVRDLNPFVWKDLQTAELFKGKRFVIFFLPGAYTPLCSSEVLEALEIFSNVYFPLPAMVDSHQRPMATPLPRSSVASTAPESPIRSSTKIIRSSFSPWATSNLKATYDK